MKAHRKALSILAMALAVALAFFIVPAITDSGGQASAAKPLQLIYYDGHMHTARSDGTGSVADIKATAQARGLSAVIITDHCWELTREEWKSLVAETKAASDGSFLALPAFEMTGREGIFNRGHMNAYNVPNPFVGEDGSNELCPEEVWPDADEGGNPAGTGVMYPENLAKWAEYVHSQSGIAQHNHTSGTTQLGYGVDTIELYNQSHVDDVMSYAMALGIPPADAWGFAITMNNFAVYGERDLNTTVTLPGFPPMSLRLAIFMATGFIPPYLGQIIGWNPPAPSLAGDLNSWDELLMAYVNRETDRPVFGTANSDAHNTADIANSKVGSAKNGLYVKKLSADEIYKAIAAGHSFATTGPSLTFDVNGQIMGDTAKIAVGGSANLSLSAKAETPGYLLARIDIYRNGQVWKTKYPIMLPAYSWPQTDTVTEDGYYRVEVTSCKLVGMQCVAYQFAWSNPVFVDVQ